MDEGAQGRFGQPAHHGRGGYVPPSGADSGLALPSGGRPTREVTVGVARIPPVALPIDDQAPRPAAETDTQIFLVEGRPGSNLVEDLAELRRRELPGGKEADEERESRRRVMPLWQEMPLLLIVAFCVAVLVRSFLVQAFVIPSSSMESTLLVGDRVLVNKVVYALRDPRRGEVVVFRGTDRWAPENVAEQPGGVWDRIGDTLGDLVGISRPGEKDFIKRVIGLPGDRVACCDAAGRVTVNGIGLDEPYLNSNSLLDGPLATQSCQGRRFDAVLVGAGQLFVMGDNRAVSLDSRCQGTIPIDHVIGRAIFVVWPTDRWGGVLTSADPIAGVLAAPVVALVGRNDRPRVARRWWPRTRTLRR
jgi:signal peptidase I